MQYVSCKARLSLGLTILKINEKKKNQNRYCKFSMKAKTLLKEYCNGVWVIPLNYFSWFLRIGQNKY